MPSHLILTRMRLLQPQRGLMVLSLRDINLCYWCGGQRSSWVLWELWLNMGLWLFDIFYVRALCSVYDNVWMVFVKVMKPQRTFYGLLEFWFDGYAIVGTCILFYQPSSLIPCFFFFFWHILCRAFLFFTFSLIVMYHICACINGEKNLYWPEY